MQLTFKLLLLVPTREIDCLLRLTMPACVLVSTAMQSGGITPKPLLAAGSSNAR